MVSIRKVDLKNGKYKYRIDVKYYDKNDRKYKGKSKSYFPPENVSDNKAYLLAEKEAEAFEKSVLGIVNSNHPVIINYMNVSFKEFAEKWLEDSRVEHNITYYEEKKPLVYYLINELDRYKVNELSPSIIQELFNKIDQKKRLKVVVKITNNFKDALRKEGWNYKRIIDSGISKRTYMNALLGENVSEKWAKDFSEHVSISYNRLFNEKKEYIDYADETKIKYKKALRLILSRAVKYGIIDRNYASSEFIDFPKTSRTKIDVMNDDEIKVFYETIIGLKNIQMKTCLLVALLTGFRRGEIAGLRWNDVDFKHNTITVNRSIRKSKELGQFVKTPKTESSNRTISIPDTLVKQLIEYKQWQDERKKDAGNGYNINDYIFTDPYGEEVRLDRMEKWMKLALEKANISHHTLHSLRHTNVALQIAAGVPIVTVASRAGHSRTSTTTDIYAYSLNGSDKSAANAINNIFADGVKRSNNIDNSLEEFKKAKEEMKRLGFDSMREYNEYLEFMRLRNKLNQS